MGRFKYLSLVFILLTASAGLLYYILVNTAFAERILPGVNFAGKQLSFANQDELNQFASSFSDNYIRKLDVYFDNIHFQVPIGDLDISISESEIQNYGKGSDITKVLSEGFALLGGKGINLDITFNTNIILKYFPYKIDQSNNGAHFEGENVKNCESNSYKLFFKESPLYEYAKISILYDTPLIISLSEILTDPAQGDIIQACLDYRTQVANLYSKIQDDQETENIKNSLVFQKTEGGYGFGILDYDKIIQSFQSIKSKLDTDAYQGEYILKGNKAYLYEQYQNGISLDVDRSMANLSYWLSIQDLDILSFSENRADILNHDYEIIDVSKLLAQGKTRIDIIRNGSFNWGMLNAEYGLEAINDYVVEPKQEFSFLRDSGADSHSYHIGGGICNATTTMFRTALEAGFEITERHPHYFNVPSYAWGYPENVVDAAFLSENPRLDLKFVNDLDYPVLLKLEITRDDNNFQYHTVSVYTSPNVPERKVEFFDFKKWNIRSDKVFDGSFSRRVYQSGELIRTDTFESKYR